MFRLLLPICLVVSACSTTLPPQASFPTPPEFLMLPPSQLKTLPPPSPKTTAPAEKRPSAFKAFKTGSEPKRPSERNDPFLSGEALQKAVAEQCSGGCIVFTRDEVTRMSLTIQALLDEAELYGYTEGKKTCTRRDI